MTGEPTYVVDPLRTGFRSSSPRVTVATVTFPLTEQTRTTAAIAGKPTSERLSRLEITLKAEEPKEGKPGRRSFRMLANSGAPFARLWMIKGKAKLVQLAIQLDGIEKLPARGLPMLVDHGAYPGPAGVVGSCLIVSSPMA